MPLRAGDVLVVNFPGVTGVKRRPALVLSSAEYHASRPDVVVGLITSRTSAALGTTDCVLQDWKQAGLHKASVFRSFFATLPRSSQLVVVGHLTERDWASVRGCVKSALDLEVPASPAAP